MTQDTTREYVSDASGLPVINQRVQIQLSVAGASADEVTGVPSRVEDVVSVPGKRPVQELLIAPPRYNGDVERPRQGHGLSIIWSTARGVLELPVEFVDVERVGAVVSAWRVRVVGPAVRVQRRSFVRVGFVTPVAIALAEDRDGGYGTVQAVPGPALPAQRAQPGSVTAGVIGVTEGASSAVIAGKTVDVSEGGLRCHLDRELAAELPVLASFVFDGETFRLDARIVRATPRPPAPGAGGPVLWDTAIRFTDPDVAGDSLRKRIFAEQMRQRRVAG